MPSATMISPTVGTIITSRVVFTEADGTLADPGVVTAVVTDPDGVPTTYTYPATITRVSDGIYTLLLPVTLAGVWHVEWIGSGSGPNVVACKNFNARDC